MKLIDFYILKRYLGTFAIMILLFIPIGIMVDLAEKIENNSVQNDLKEIRDELANLSSNNTSSTTIDPAVMERLQSAPSSGASDNAAGLSELKYYIVELMKDQNEIRQIVKELREILEKNEEN